MKPKPKNIDLSIVIPALNEGKRLGKSLDELRNFLKKNDIMKNLVCEVLVVSADSNDDTHAVAMRHGKLIDNFDLLLPGKRVGKGRDVKYGMLRAKGNYVLFMDADLATPLRHLPEFLSQIQQGYDVVFATRNLRKHHSNLIRRSLSNAGNLAFRLLGGVWTEDSQCGFKMFTASASKICFGKQTINGWGFDMEVLTIANTQHLNIKPIRIDDWKDVAGGTFKASSIIFNALFTLKDLLHIVKNRLGGAYGNKDSGQ
jgi:dolichyl-phosphate beta-glucosyltransferase